ncbi:MAG: transglutaminase family protein [Candidatus Sumerlaeia bacterium]|nr:transglutaminase family protein [Candidatus Sumerlaeia bacterium]
MTRYRVSHATRYRYAEAVSQSYHKLHLVPRATARQRVERAELLVRPHPSFQRSRRDFYGNTVSVLSIQEPHHDLEAVLDAELAVMAPSLGDPSDTPSWEFARELLRSDLSPEGVEAVEFAHASPHVPLLADAAALAAPCFTPGRPVLEAALALNEAIHRGFSYSPLATDVSTPVEEVLRSRRGVCQDFAHLMISCLRSVGLAARYVSGYLATDPEPGARRLVGADASHAWLALMVPGTGWVDLDPTNDALVRDRHLTLAWGRDYGDVSPLRGVIQGGGRQQLSVAVTVVPA